MLHGEQRDASGGAASASPFLLMVQMVVVRVGVGSSAELGCGVEERLEVGSRAQLEEAG